MRPTPEARNCPSQKCFQLSFPLTTVVLPPPSLSFRTLLHCYPSKRQISSCLPQRQNSAVVSCSLQVIGAHLFFNCFVHQSPEFFSSLKYPIPQSGIPPIPHVDTSKCFSFFKTYLTSHLCNAICHAAFPSLPLSLHLSSFFPPIPFLLLIPPLFSQMKSVVTMVLYENLHLHYFTVLHLYVCTRVPILTCDSVTYLSALPGWYLLEGRGIYHTSFISSTVFWKLF